MQDKFFFDTFGEIVYICDFATYELLYMNEGGLNLVNETRESIKGKKCHKVLQGFDAPCSFCTNRFLRHDRVYAWEHKNLFLGRYFSLRDKLIHWEGRPARIELALDVTDLKKEMANTEFKMTSMIQSIPGGICQFADDGEYTVLWYNDKFLEILGYTEQQFADELCGKGRYVHPDDMPTSVAVMQEAKQTGLTKTMEMRIVRRDGDIRTLLTTLSHIAGGGGVPVFYSVGIDITEYRRQEEQNRKKMEKALEMAHQASQAKSRFLSRMSHEIRTPLNAVIGMTDIASRSEGDKKVLRNCHRKINSAANYLLSLINDVLEVSRIESGKLALSEKSFSFPDFLYDVVDLFSAEADRKQITFDIDVDVFPEEQFRGDPLHLKQIFVNLLGNAFKFTEAGGQVSLEVRKLSRSADTTRLEISVADTGIGIKTEFLDRIFNAFEQETSETTSHYGGSGLGLSICRHLVELMGGSIEVSSREGEGSIFKVRLPLHAESLPPGPETAPTGAPVLRLLIADEARHSSQAARALEGGPIRLDCVLDAGLVLPRLAEAAEQGIPYDVVLLSASFPSVRSVAERIARQGVRVMLTGVHSAVLDQLSRELCGCRIVRKPFFRSSLLKELNAALVPDDGDVSTGLREYDFSGKRVLVVEDNELNMEISCAFLHMCRFEVEKARDGREAVELFNSRPAGYFDVILMDIFMPVMDGLTASERIRALEKEGDPRIPIIALSANAFEEDRQRSLRCGMDAHLAKPFDLETLCAVLRTVLR